MNHLKRLNEIKLEDVHVISDEIHPGNTYRCIDDKGNVRVRRVEAIDSQPYVPMDDRKVYYTDTSKQCQGSLYIRTFSRQAKGRVEL